MNARKATDTIIEVIHASEVDRATVAHMLAPVRGDTAKAGARSRRIVDALNDVPDPTATLQERVDHLEAQLKRERASYHTRYAEAAAEGVRTVREARKEAATVIALLTGLTDADLSSFTWTSTPDGELAVKPVRDGAAFKAFHLKVAGTAWSLWADDTWLAGGGATDPVSARDHAIGWVRYLHGFPVSFQPAP